MNQNIWGPHLWFSLHTITFAYPLKPNDQDKAYYKNYFESMQNVIPCSVCKKNYIRHLKESPIEKHLASRRDLVYWLIDLHNLVNGKTGKKIWSYESVIKKYEKVYGKKIVLSKSDPNIENDLFPEGNINETFVNGGIESKNVNYLLYFLFIIFVIILIINFIHFLRCSSSK